MTEPVNKNGKQVPITVLTLVITGVLGWVGYTVITLLVLTAKHDEQIVTVKAASTEIVPRAENERRWEGLEKHQQADEERINQLERIVYSIATSGKTQISYEPR